MSPGAPVFERKCYCDVMDPTRVTTSIEGGEPAADAEAIDLGQIVERLGWTPIERLRYLLDMLDFEEKAHRAKSVDH